MSESTLLNHDPMTEALLLPLYFRAMEWQRPDALLRDERAVELVRRMGLDAARLQQAQVQDEVAVSVLLRNREFDRQTRDYLSCHTQAVVVHIGCGLDSRFERVDDGRVEWYDLDLPEAMELRRKLLGGEGLRYHQLACSVLDSSWREAVSVHAGRPFLFLAEGVFMFLEEAQVKGLVLTLRERFPGAELVFDAFSPLYVWGNNRRVARSGVGALAHWGLKHPRDLESWGPRPPHGGTTNPDAGIRLLDEWYPFLCPEPRLGRARWARYIPGLGKVTGVYHYRLGNPVA